MERGWLGARGRGGGGSRFWPEDGAVGPQKVTKSSLSRCCVIFFIFHFFSLSPSFVLPHSVDVFMVVHQTAIGLIKLILPIEKSGL